MAALDLGYMANAAAVRDMKPEVVYLLGADSGAISKEDLPEGAFVIYQVFYALISSRLDNWQLAQLSNT